MNEDEQKIVDGAEQPIEAAEEVVIKTPEELAEEVTTETIEEEVVADVLETEAE